nr:unnamed protein product [Callosobruchus chinensis]CAH7737774.1 unnamed protein product [Callosobruchus chinensis]CAH7742303.1 unnamed protein product [Callosobruchus chinensis]CAH7743007.1 unnamed protein product [Callosobruchus chinensis]CAH7756536.1 unnamed protein product [Callosobruchus chinensis]
MSVCGRLKVKIIRISKRKVLLMIY